MRARRLVGLVAALALGVTGTATASAQGPGPATTPTSPVDLATHVDFADGVATRGATVTAGDARFEVLGSGLIRLQYSPGRHFLDLPTVNVLDRRFPVPRYRERVRHGVLTITTSHATLRYRLGSGPFGPLNTSLSYDTGHGGATVTPQWQSECPFDQACQSGAAALSGGAAIQDDHTGFQSVAGFIGGLGQDNGAAADWRVLGAPAGTAEVAIRYSNYVGALGGPAARTIDLTVNGADARTLTLPPTASWDDWSTVTATVHLTGGTDTVGLRCGTADSCNVNVDTLSVTPAGFPAPSVPDLGTLGGYTRSFDSATYGPGFSCPAGTPDAPLCTAALPVMHPGILDRAGYQLLDDTPSAVWTRSGWVEPRPAGGDVQDGYLFTFGHDYAQALRDLNRLTGPSPLPDESIFGVWYSDYYPYTTADYERSLIPAFRAHGVPIDDLSVDTDWKAPNQWDGWEWNPALFPDPQAFLSYARAQGIHVTLNIHPSISTADRKLPAAEAIAGNTLASATCFSGPCKVWDWSRIPQAESYFALQQPFQEQGVNFWWLDWCCDNSIVSMPGLTPDNWIDHLHAQDLANQGRRGFVLARIGSSYQSPDEDYPAGPWSAHTSVLAFTGDTWGTWNTLAFQAQLSADEASIDEPYLSDDIGSFLGPPPGMAFDTPDLYARWVQLGAFQPVLRLHSCEQPGGCAGEAARDAGGRLPWEYPQPADQAATDALRLREVLVPYTYTLAAQSVVTGLPITRPLYLDYPDQAAAYANPTEELYGPDVLVAPVTTPGDVVSEKVWFPPGRWTDWFTGATFSGPAERTLTVPLDRMPVFVRDGGIIPEQAPMDHVGADPTAPTTLRVYPGGPGRFDLYQDSGSGTGYERGEHSLTTITSRSAGRLGTVVIGPSRGRYAGQQAARRFDVQWENLTRPRLVLVDGHRLPEASAGHPGWTWDPVRDTVTVPVAALGLDQSARVTEIGARQVSRPEPAALSVGITPSAPLSVAPGAATTVTTTETDAGPGAATHLSVALSAPAGWKVAPAPPVTAGALRQGGAATQTWTVTAPAGSVATEAATLVATATYASAGLPEVATASQQPPPPAAPLPPPTITSVSPSAAPPGSLVTVSGANFGATQGSSYVTLAQGGTSWGAPFDAAKLTITAWSDTSISFDLPPSSGPFPLQPGSATVTVTVGAQSSAPATITVGSG